MTTRRKFKDGIAVMIVRLTVCYALVLTGCSDSINSEVAAPVVVRSDAWEPPAPTEAAILADRLLRREDNGLLLDAAEQQELADEIAPVLSRIRDAHPAVADITARAPYAFGELLLTLEPWLFEIVSSLLDGQTGPVTLHTGHMEFDTLNTELGLSAVVEMFPSFKTIIFYFNEHLNVAAAAAAYAAMEGIESAEPNAYLGDGSDIDAVHSQGRWHVVLRRAWGDCPSGCVNQELYFFMVNGAGVERIERTQALNNAEFRELVMNRGWN